MNQEEGLQRADVAKKQAKDCHGLANYATESESSGKAALFRLIHQLRWKAEVYQALYNALPERLTSNQSAGLNTLISNQK